MCGYHSPPPSGQLIRPSLQVAVAVAVAVVMWVGGWMGGEIRSLVGMGMYGLSRGEYFPWGKMDPGR